MNEIGARIDFFDDVVRAENSARGDEGKRTLEAPGNERDDGGAALARRSSGNEDGLAAGLAFKKRASGADAVDAGRSADVGAALEFVVGKKARQLDDDWTACKVRVLGTAGQIVAAADGRPEDAAENLRSSEDFGGFGEAAAQEVEGEVIGEAISAAAPSGAVPLPAPMLMPVTPPRR